MNAEGMILTAGGISFLGNWKEQGGMPSNTFQIVGATLALVILASLARNSPINGPVKAAAGLMLLVAVYRYIPAFNPTKGK